MQRQERRESRREVGEFEMENVTLEGELDRITSEN
jgi:hypothetical protein